MIYVILIVATILRLVSLNQSFWLDEAAQAVLSQKPIFAVNYAADFQPPLYYVFSHYWMKIGELFGTQAEWFLRIPSMMFALGTIYLLYQFVSSKFSKKVGLIAAGLLAVAPFHIYYSQEFRMYSALTFLALLSWILLDKKKWFAYAVVTTMAIFTHYFAFVLLLSQVIYMLVVGRKNWKCFFGSIAVGLFPFILWIPTFLKQIETSQQLVQAWPGWSALSNIAFLKFPGIAIAKFTVGMISPENRVMYGLATALVGAIILIACWQLFKKFKAQKKHQKNILLIASYFVVPLLIAWIGGLFVSASTPWRIQFVLPAFYAIIAVGTVKMKHFKLILVVLVTIQLSFTTMYLSNEKFHREDWRSAVSYADSKVGESGKVITEFVGPWAPMEWYSNSYDKYAGGSTTQRITQDSVISQEANPIVLFSYLFEISDPERNIETKLLEQGYKLIEEKDFRGVGIIRIFEST